MVNCDLYKVKLFLLQLAVETSRLWHYYIRSVVRISVKSGSGPYSSAVSSIRTSRIHLCSTTSYSPGMCVEEYHVTLTG